MKLLTTAAAALGTVLGACSTADGAVHGFAQDVNDLPAGIRCGWLPAHTLYLEGVPQDPGGPALCWHFVAVRDRAVTSLGADACDASEGKSSWAGPITVQVWSSLDSTDQVSMPVMIGECAA